MPVKIVINCKNSKRKPSKPKRMEEDRRMGQMNDFEYDQYAAAEEIFSKEEVYFTGRENIEGFACIINSFIR
jgi:hypothetical protein